MRCATAIVKALEAVGTEIAFAYNGHGNWALLDAIEYESSIRGVACRGEDHAVHMADGYARSKKGPIPIVCTSVGPGNMNIAPALATAFFESSPMLVLAGGGSTHWLDRGGIEEFYRYGPDEWIQSVKTYTKKAVMISRPDTAVDMVLRAYKTAVTGRPGPVVLQVPFDIQHSETAVDLSSVRGFVAVCPPGPDLSGIKRAAELIANAARPMVFVSGGVRHAAANRQLACLVEEFGIPVGTTTMGKGAYPENKPLSLGCIGRAGAGHANRAAGECDVLIAIGTHFSDIDTGGWTLFDIPGKTRLIHIDIDPEEIGRVYPTEVGLYSDARLALEALLPELRGRGLDSKRFTGWRDDIARWRGEWEQSVGSIRDEGKSPLGYGFVCHQVGKLLSESYPDSSLFVDTGHLLSFAPPFLEQRLPNFHHCGFFHRMGWSLPAALGAKFARPDAPAVVLMGDGSFMFSNSSLATAREYDKPLVVLVMNNRSLQIERELMEKKYGRSAFVDYRIERTKEMWGPDYLKIADAMEAAATKVSRPEELMPALRMAMESGTTHVIDIDIDLHLQGYRSVWYPYPDNFWTPRDQLKKTF
jgi:acetolactate synthase-1/2/3 large subunit